MFYEITSKYSTCQLLRRIGLSDEDILQIAIQEDLSKSSIVLHNMLNKKGIKWGAMRIVQVAKLLKEEL